MMRVARHLCGGLLTAFCLAMTTIAHAAVSHVTVQSITPIDIGAVISAPTGVTVFRAAPGGGVTVFSGGGIRTASGSVLALVTIKCDTDTTCVNDDIKVSVGPIAAVTGRAGALTNFTIAMHTGLMSGSTSGTSPVTFTIKKLGSNGTASFYVGADFPIGGNDSSGASGAAATGYYAYVATSPSTPTVGSTGGTATAVVTRALGLTGTGALNFGWIAAPTATGATGNVAIDADNDGLAGRHLTNLYGFATPVPSRVVMTASGDPGRQISISIPTSIVLTRSGGSDTLQVTMSSNAGSTANLNTAGIYSFGIGGSMNVSHTTPTGLYNGTFLVSVAYN
jgi:hypothetical protein